MVQMLQDGHLADIGAKRKQSTPRGAADAESCGNALATPHVLEQRLASASDPDDSALQGELVRHSSLRSARAVMRMAHCVAISRVVLIEDGNMRVTRHDGLHAVSCHAATSEGDLDCTRR